MNFLVDTHVLIWSLFEPSKLSPQARKILKDPTYTWKVSTLTFIEIALKYSKGKLDLQGVRPDDLPGFATKAGFLLMDITPLDVAGFWKLPLHNTDPFDRLLVWQTIQRNLTLISKDSSLEVYKSNGLNLVW